MQAANKTSIWSVIGSAFYIFGSVVLISVLFFVLYWVAFQGKLLQDKVNTLTETASTLKINLSQTQETITQTNEAVKQNIAELMRSVNTNKETWRVIEAQNDVKLANNQLQLQGNIEAAKLLLQAADAEIRDLNSPKLDNIRKALAEDLAALQAVTPLDVTGLYMKLSALDGKVDQLPLLMRQNPPPAPLATSAENKNWWKKGLQESWAELQKIIVVRHQVENVPPLIAPDAEVFLRQNLHAKFAEAKWALLNKNQQIYATSLSELKQWIEQYFVTPSPLTQGMLVSIAELEKMNIHPALPGVITSLQSFHDYLAVS